MDNATIWTSSSSPPPMSGNDGEGLQRKTYAQLKSEATKFNILEFTITNIDTSLQFDKKALSDDEFSSFVFDTLKIDPEMCLEFDYFPGPINMKFIKVKDDLQVSSYTSGDPYTFKNFHIKVTSSNAGITKVTFLYAGLDVPDEEILNLCDTFGEPISIHRKKMKNSRNMGSLTAKRVVHMKLKQNASFNNYYWLDSIVPGRPGSRVLVLHDGQQTQCGHCLQNGFDCPEGGVAKICRKEHPEMRMEMNAYMNNFKRETGYRTLKEQDEGVYPSFQGRTVTIHSPATDSMKTKEELADQEALKAIEEIRIDHQMKLNELKEDLAKVSKEKDYVTYNLDGAQNVVDRLASKILGDMAQNKAEVNHTLIHEDLARLRAYLSTDSDVELEHKKTNPDDDSFGISSNIYDKVVDQNLEAQDPTRKLQEKFAKSVRTRRLSIGSHWSRKNEHNPQNLDKKRKNSTPSSRSSSAGRTRELQNDQSLKPAGKATKKNTQIPSLSK